MASWFDYSDSQAGYLPGEIYRATGLSGRLQQGTKGWKFQPSSFDNGTEFNKFLALTKNPNVLSQNLLQAPGMNLYVE